MNGYTYLMIELLIFFLTFCIVLVYKIKNIVQVLVELKGNPVKLGDGPAAVTSPLFLFKIREPFLRFYATMHFYATIRHSTP